MSLDLRVGMKVFNEEDTFGELKKMTGMESIIISTALEMFRSMSLGYAEPTLPEITRREMGEDQSLLAMPADSLDDHTVERLEDSKNEPWSATSSSPRTQFPTNLTVLRKSENLELERRYTATIATHGSTADQHTTLTASYNYLKIGVRVVRSLKAFFRAKKEISQLKKYTPGKIYYLEQKKYLFG
ncbi:hypothetical protein P153DRAFT_412523 [Dothidotthia symphoricarpi CBS 119687]|uniref:Uncharacterized protein n=1 Tax=Dothidotthia symphoricarpi CBS 119687 TaxID=1392245 RepID=A0A6A5ZVD0_9PLEO|nr:uncharacterized protein P153DRAFT_412523 [Dothidotthia symphoricarpi CBS 119687]KAF2123672.1 hypothetical protein P153DRAFT_412523 [Dothidotthia symphoricarpi CBS 119687]